MLNSKFRKLIVSFALAAVMGASMFFQAAVPASAEDLTTVTEEVTEADTTEEVEETEDTEEVIAEEIVTEETDTEEIVSEEAAEEESAETEETAEETAEVTVEGQEEVTTQSTSFIVTTSSEYVTAQAPEEENGRSDGITSSAVKVGTYFEEAEETQAREVELLMESSKTMYGDTTAQLNVVIMNASSGKIRWRSTDTSVAEVDENGVITAKASGTCKIVAKVKGTDVKAVCKLTVIRYKVYTVNCTAYCSCSKCCGKSDGITATGTHVTEGRTIAVDPKMIPLGSKVEIDGHIYIAEDVGGGVKGNRIDIYFGSHYRALLFGRRTKTIKVYY